WTAGFAPVRARRGGQTRAPRERQKVEALELVAGERGGSGSASPSRSARRHRVRERTPARDSSKSSKEARARMTRPTKDDHHDGAAKGPLSHLPRASAVSEITQCPKFSGFGRQEGRSDAFRQARRMWAARGAR